MKEKFTNEEWQLLKLLPFQVFILVASADGNVDKKEIGAFAEEMKAAPFFKDPLHREIALEIVTSGIDQLLSESLNVANLHTLLSRQKAILKNKLTPDEYQRFVGSLFISGLKIARASGGGFMGLGEKISPKERLALAAFAALFELDLSTIAANFS